MARIAQSANKGNLFMSNLLSGGITLKPYNYPWAFQGWLEQQQAHWLHLEISLADDVRDFHKSLSVEEKNLVTQIFRFFTQADTDVNNAYIDLFMPTFKPIEIRNMLVTFSAMESIHEVAYSYLLDTVGMPETDYQAFLQYKEMSEKHDYLKSFNVNDNYEIAKSLAVFSGFSEGLQLFASFAMLLNFPRFNKMKGMGQIVTYSIRDEQIHVNYMTKLFRTFVQENPEIWNDNLKKELYTICENIVELEDKFIDLAFEMGPVKGLSASEMKRYIRYIADRRLHQLGLHEIYKIQTNPLPWLDEILNGTEHTNFFEQRATEYSKAASTGIWNDAFDS